MGAENLGHSVLAAKGAVVVPDYLVIEVALYAKAPLRIRADQFQLRINGKKSLVSPQSTGFVAASLTYPDWETRPNLSAGVGIGNAGATIGQPVPVGRFPGDRVPTRRPPVADTDPSGGVEKDAAEKPEEIVNRTALQEGDAVHPPVSGYVFFPFRSKLKSIKTLELIYEGPLGTATLRLP